MERFLFQGLGLAVALVRPGSHIHEVLVVAEGLAVVGLMLGAEMPTAGFLTVQGIIDDELSQLKIVFQPIGFLQFGVELVGGAGDEDLFPELLFQFRDQLFGFRKAFCVACHAAVFP